MKEFADNNFKLDENGRKLSKQVENTVGKGEIAHNEQFLLYPQCFQKACFPGASKGVIVREWVKKNIVYNVFYAICILKFLIATFQVSSAASLNLGRYQNGVSGNGLMHLQITNSKLPETYTLSQTTNFRLSQAERVCRQC